LVGRQLRNTLHSEQRKASSHCVMEGLRACLHPPSCSRGLLPYKHIARLEQCEGNSLLSVRISSELKSHDKLWELEAGPLIRFLFPGRRRVKRQCLSYKKNRALSALGSSSTKGNDSKAPLGAFANDSNALSRFGYGVPSAQCESGWQQYEWSDGCVIAHSPTLEEHDALQALCVHPEWRDFSTEMSSRFAPTLPVKPNRGDISSSIH
jgi:hypothetical protein